MAITRVPRDKNGATLTDRWTEVYTYRYTAVNATTGQAIATPSGIDSKEVWVHIEGSNPVATIKGTVTGSADAYLTTDGITMVFPVVREAAKTVLTYVKAPAGTTVNVSIVIGR